MVDEPTERARQASLRPGAIFGHYRLQRLLGRGGFGEVFEAVDTVMERTVALKLLASGYSDNEAFRQRLFREARNAGKLHEPHVVPIHHCGEIDGQLYIDMRLIDGTDLQKTLSRSGSLSPVRSVGIVRQIAAALNAAHSAGLVHRDVKPANILLAEDDFAYLVDFGLANAATDAKLTSSGMTIGTFAYMAPERFSNTDVDHHADIYALACVLYECLTGTTPYPNGDLPALMHAHLTAPIPQPSRNRPTIPAGFDDVIAVGLAKKPGDRFASANQLATAARHALRPVAQRQADATAGGSGVAAKKAPAKKAGPPAKPIAQQSRKATPKEQKAAAIPPRKTAQPAKKTPPQTAKPAPPAAKKNAPPTPPPRPATAATRWRRLSRRNAILLLTLAVIAVIAIPVALTTVLDRTARTPQVQHLALDGILSPVHIAVDTAGSIYVTDAYMRVVRFSTLSQKQEDLAFKDLKAIGGLVAKDNVYVTDPPNNRVLKLPDKADQVVLPFTDLKNPAGVAVDDGGNVYVSDSGNQRVLKLPAVGGSQTPMPFNGLNDPEDLAVDDAAVLYLIDSGNHRVLKMPPVAGTQTELPFTGLQNPTGVAVDHAGNIYVTDSGTNRVLKMLAGSTNQVELPFGQLNNPRGITVDNDGNVYVAEYGSNYILKLPT